MTLIQIKSEVIEAKKKKKKNRHEIKETAFGNRKCFFWSGSFEVEVEKETKQETDLQIEKKNHH